MRAMLVRHLAPAIERGVCYGRLDVPLHPAALEAVPAFVTQPSLRGARCVWSSPSQRCRRLAEAIAFASQIPLRLDPRLGELDFGEWEGKPWSSIDRATLDRWAATPMAFEPPGGESGHSLIRRVGALHDAVRRRAENCIIVSHAGPLKVLTSLLRGEPVNLFNPSPPFGAIIPIDCSDHPTEAPNSPIGI